MRIEVPFSAGKLGKHIERQPGMAARAFIKAELDRKEHRTSKDSRSGHILIGLILIYAFSFHGNPGDIECLICS
jgi:hypothetical protein